MHSHDFWEQNHLRAFTQLAFQLADAKWDFYFQYIQEFIKKQTNKKHYLEEWRNSEVLRTKSLFEKNLGE